MDVLSGGRILCTDAAWRSGACDGGEILPTRCRIDDTMSPLRCRRRTGIPSTSRSSAGDRASSAAHEKTHAEKEGSDRGADETNQKPHRGMRYPSEQVRVEDTLESQDGHDQPSHNEESIRDVASTRSKSRRLQLNERGTPVQAECRLLEAVFTV
jgi:hypothetical protein